MFDRCFDRDIILTELLVTTGFVKPHDLDRAYACCRDENTPLRNILLQQRMVEPDILAAGVEVLKKINEGHLAPAEARSVLFLMGNCKLSISDAMIRLGIVPARNPWHQRLFAMQAEQQPV